MRTAVLYDIHGNLPALEAVLQEVQQADIEELVVGGDILLGPMPRECMDLLLAFPHPIHFIQGNCEEAVLNYLTHHALGSFPQSVQEDICWTADQLLPKQLEQIVAWPKSLTVHVKGLGSVLFCHATPRSSTENITRLTSAEKLVPIFASLATDIVICGHTHMQYDRTIAHVRIINAGSVGMPFGKPGAYWLLLGEEIELRYTAYDLMEAAERIRSTPYPHAEDFATKQVLHPPTEEEMLRIFGSAEI